MERAKLGVVSVVGLGYEVIVRALWVILIPVVLDFFLWLGPQLSIRPLIERLIAAAAEARLDSPLQQVFEDSQRLLIQTAEHFNLFSLLATDFAGVRMPSLKTFSLVPADAAPMPAPPAPVVSLDNEFVLVATSLALLAGGWLIAVVYLTLIGDRVRAGQENLKPFAWRVLTSWLRLLLFVGLLIALFLSLSLPFIVVLSIAALIHSVLWLMVFAAAWVISFWLLFYLWFVAYAIVIGNSGLWRAVWNSANVVQRNLLATFGLILLSNVITGGMLIIWQQFERSLAGSVIAIVGNAFIGSGLMAANCIFYQDRYQAWQASTAKGQLRAAGAES